MSFKINKDAKILHQAVGLTEKDVDKLAVWLDVRLLNQKTMSQIAHEIHNTKEFTNKHKFYLTFLLGYAYKSLVNRHIQEIKQKAEGANKQKGEEKNESIRRRTIIGTDGKAKEEAKIKK